MTTETTKKPLRYDDWWKGKAAHLMGLVYVWAIWFSIPFLVFIPLSICSVITIIGFASFGYLLNDYYDIEQDKASGKSNIFQTKSPFETALLFGFSLFAMLTPWVYLPGDTVSWSLISMQLLLFLLYSHPWVRLKEKGVAGLVVDTLYAHVVPSGLAAYTFLKASGKTAVFLPFLLLIVWQLFVGLRNILLHQFEDISADKKAGSRNFAATIPKNSFGKIIRVLSIIELVFATLFFIGISQFQMLLWIPVFLLIVLLFLFTLNYMNRLKQLLPHHDWKHFPNFVYESWLPIMLLCILSVLNIAYISVLIVHCILFEYNLLATIFRKILLLGKEFIKKGFIYSRIGISYVINYFIFYLFLLFGINLKKEHTSAWQYLKKRFRKQEAD